MSQPAGSSLDRILAESDEVDDALRKVVELVAAQDGVTWAAVAFLDEGALEVGPAAGTPNESRRAQVPILFNGDPVGELLADGDPDLGFLQLVADRIGPLALIGWDTGGEAWEP